MRVLSNQYCVISNDDRYLYDGLHGLTLDTVPDLDSIFDNVEDALLLRDKANNDDEINYYKFYVVKINKEIVYL